MIEYIDKIHELINRIETTQKSNIAIAAEWLSSTIVDDNIIHTFGTGHSHILGMEIFSRAGGLANVNAILDDLVLTTSGARRGGELEATPYHDKEPA
jgi:uncharacterized phosphosugar-binding protein